MKVDRYKPTATATFFTEQGELVARATGDIDKTKFDEDIVSIQTVRDMGADAPTFSINLTRRRKWHKYVTPNDLVVIRMCRPPHVEMVVMVGVVDDIRKRTQVSDNDVQRVITITGRGMAKSLIQFDIGVIPEARTNLKIGWLEDMGVTIMQKSASEIAKAVWNKVAKPYINYEWSDGRNLFEVVNTDFDSRKNIQLVDQSGLINWQGSLWAFFKEITDEPFNEIYWEIINDKPTFVLRPTPFNPEDWETLPIKEIEDIDVVMDDTGRSDIETYTLYSVGMKMYFSSADPYKTHGLKPLYYPPYEAKYGLRRLHEESLYVAYASHEDKQQVVDVVREYRELLYNWNIRNNHMFNGTLIVRGDSKFKVGERLLYKSNADESTMEYYIRSVSHNFVNFGTWTTELSVTRGDIPENRFDPPYGTGMPYDGTGMIGESVDRDPSDDSTDGSHNPQYSPELDDIDTVTATDIVSMAEATTTWGIYYNYGAPVSFMESDNPSADCSSFTKWLFNEVAGINLPRVSRDQANMGTRITYDQLQPGDLVFFKNTGDRKGITHVGVYTGDGDFIGSQSSTGVAKVTDFMDNSYWSSHWSHGVRILQSTTAVRDVSAPTSEYAINNQYSKTTISGVTHNVLDAELEGVLAHKGQAFIDAGNEHGVDPAFLAAIAMHETGNGTSNMAKEKNNVGGIMDWEQNWSTGRYFSSVEDSIDFIAKTVAGYNAQTLAEVQKIYCPEGASNDSNNLNQHWQSGTIYYLKRIYKHIG